MLASLAAIPGPGPGRPTHSSSETSLRQALDGESGVRRSVADRQTAAFYIALLQCGETLFRASIWTFSRRCG
jgi:hypothetical protein